MKEVNTCLADNLIVLIKSWLKLYFITYYFKYYVFMLNYALKWFFCYKRILFSSRSSLLHAACYTHQGRMDIGLLLTKTLGTLIDFLILDKCQNFSTYNFDLQTCLSSLEVYFLLSFIIFSALTKWTPINLVFVLFIFVWEKNGIQNG